MNNKKILRTRRHLKIRAKLSGTHARPRLIIYRSLMATHAQLVDDEAGKTLISTSDVKLKKGNKTERAAEVGKTIAVKALEQKIKTCVFDRNGYKYHGRVKAVAEAAREAGLQF